VLAALLLRRALGPWRRWERALLVALIAVIVADQFRLSLGQLCGRDWPATWYGNPSLLGTGAYGFHPFQPAENAGSFPSGHAARIAAFFAVFWLMLPGGRWLYAAAAIPMLIALVGMNYHFVGDVIAGGTLGGIVGACGVRLGRIGEAEAS
jgi:membrane-associated phospholipid phosphatase